MKDYQGLINNTYHVGHIETDNRVICSMPEDVTNHFVFPNFSTPMPGTLRGVIDNAMAPRDKIYLNGLGMIKGKSGGLSMMMKTGMEVAHNYTVFEYTHPNPTEIIKVPS